MANYWGEFYKTFSTLECSSFCNYVIDYVSNTNIKNVLDAGCGNGRDAYRLGKFYDVTGIDISSYIPESNEKCSFIEGDFCTHDKDNYQLIYSRFTFHSITNEQHKIFLSSIKKTGTILCIECRSDKDKDEFKVHGVDHYRNFINSKYLIDLIKKYDFDIEYIEEGRGFAPYKNEDPVCIRIIARKN